MPKKKKFIDRKNAVTFHLVHRSQKDPLQEDEDASRLVLQPLEPFSEKDKIEARKEEQYKFGIYYDDDYDYTQHLRGINEFHSDLQPDEGVQYRSRKSDNVTVKEPEDQHTRLQLPFSAFGSAVETDVGLLNRAAPDRDPKVDWDPDIVATLVDDFDFDDPDNQLEDDFVQLANAPMNQGEEHQKNSQSANEDYPSDEADDESDFSNSGSGSFGERSYNDEETKSRFTNYSMSSSVIRRNEGLTLLDDRFEKIFEEYDDLEIGGLDHEDIEGSMYQGQTVLNSVMEEYEKQQQKVNLKDVTTPEDVAVMSDSSDSDGEIVKMKIEKEKPEWDCESIISTYSNLYNHPKTIPVPGRDSKIRLTHRAGIPAGVLPERGLSARQLEIEMKKSRQGDSACTYRPKNESAEEKRQRKKQIKEERKERREEKKANKEAFKSEHLKQERELLNVKKNIINMKLS